MGRFMLMHFSESKQKICLKIYQEMVTFLKEDARISDEEIISKYAAKLLAHGFRNSPELSECFIDYLDKHINLMPIVKRLKSWLKDEEKQNILNWFEGQIIDRLVLLLNICGTKEILRDDILFSLTSNSTDFSQSLSITLSNPTIFTRKKEVHRQLVKEYNDIADEWGYRAAALCAAGSITTGVVTRGLSLIGLLAAPVVAVGAKKAYKYLVPIPQLGDVSDEHVKQATSSYSASKKVISAQELHASCTFTQHKGKEIYDYLAAICIGNHPDLDQFELNKKSAQQLARIAIDAYHFELSKEQELVDVDRESKPYLFSWIFNNWRSNNQLALAQNEIRRSSLNL